jgi:HEPN domain-containing protein
MAPDPPSIDPRVIAAYLDDVDVELDAARRLIVTPPNRLAAFHLQQAAEKLVKAVRLGRNLRVTNDHNIELLIEALPPTMAGAPSSRSSSRSRASRRRIATRHRRASARTARPTTKSWSGS